MIKMVHFIALMIFVSVTMWFIFLVQNQAVTKNVQAPSHSYNSGTWKAPYSGDDDAGVHVIPVEVK